MEITSNSFIILLLQVIKFNGNVESLVNLGYNYAQIADTLVIFRQQSIIKNTEEGISLTEAGYKLLIKLNKEDHRSGLSRWISPKIEERIERIDLFDIYLPNKKTKLG